MIEDRFSSQKLFIHENYKLIMPSKDDTFHLLPAYDEYLISYKDRTHILDDKYRSMAFTRNGIFRPIILHDGHAVGNWKRNKNSDFDITFWDTNFKVNNESLLLAKQRLQTYSN